VRRTLGLVCAFLVAGAPGAAAQESLEVGRFGQVTLYRASPHPRHVVLFASGDGGWNQGVVDMARALADQDALVVGIDLPHYLRRIASRRESCSYFAGDLEALSQQLQKQLARPRYTAPVLVGYSSGATLVYAALVQAPPNTFRGAISLGFCPALPLAKPACRGQGLEEGPRSAAKRAEFLPAPALASPWIALQGELDQVCEPEPTEAFAKRVGHGEIAMLPGVGHGFSVPSRWLPQLRAAFDRIAAGAALVGGSEPDPAFGSALIAGLPLVERLPSRAAAGDLMAVLVSGDGGWAGLDRELAGALADQGVPVAGLDSLQYFWTRRSPEEASSALGRMLEHYLAAWRKQRALLIGYSRGADVLPFMASHLPASALERVALVALLGPGTHAEFEFHLVDWLRDERRPQALPVLPEVEKLRGRRVLCVYGRDEADSLCPRIPKGLAALEERPGGHHFGGDYRAIAERILAAAR